MGPLAGLVGEGDASTPDLGATNNAFTQLMSSLIAEQPAALNAQQTFGPSYNALTTGEIGTNAGSFSDLISQLIPGLQSTLTGANTAAATGATANASTLGPAAAAAIGATNPAEAANLTALNDSATSGLKAGTTLAPSDLSNIDNSVRSNWASRGLGTAAPAQLDQALQEFAGGQSLLSQRQSTAASTANLDSNLVTMPSLGLSQTQSAAPGVTSNLLGLSDSVAGPSGNTLTDPTSVLSGAYNAQAAAQITSANNSAALASY